MKSTFKFLERSVLKHGFYITQAQPPSEGTARAWFGFCDKERQFLENDPWCTVEGSRLGIHNLCVRIVGLLDAILRQK